MIATAKKVKTCCVTTADHKPLEARDLAAAYEWWRDAGVDQDYLDDVTDWLAEPEAAQEAPKPSPAKRQLRHEREKPPLQKIDLLGPNPPQDLAAFREWWLSEPALDSIGPRGRVPPRGKSGAKLMLVVVDPEQGDSEKLLSQAQGRLVSRMLAAMQIAPDDVYFASTLPRHTPMADPAALNGFGQVLQHHIGLVSPQRVLIFGARILPLLGHETAQEPASLEKIEHDGFSVAAMAAEGLDSMMAMPQLKARFWRRWLEWTGE